MQYTGNLGLKKPEGTDVVNIDDLNQNFDILDVEVVKVASPTQNGRMSAADKAKLDGIEAGAQRNTVTSVNNKTGAVILTASDVGASPTGHTHTFAEITNKPTTLSGYGITDAIPTSQKGAANGVASLDGSAKVPTTQLPSASTTQAGIVKLNDTLTSTSTTQAATANAVKQVNDAVVAHLADTTKHVTAAERATWNSIRQKHQVTADDGSAINISGQDLNNIKMTGIYIGDNLTNAPIPEAAGKWCYIEVIRHNDNYIIQKAYKLNFGQNSLYMRRCEAGTWSAWSEDLFTSVSDGKAQLESTITAKGGTVTKAGAVPTFAELNSGINSIPTGKRWASGTVSNVSTVTVTGLTFKPSIVIVENISDNNARSVYWGNNLNLDPVIYRYGSIIGNSYQWTINNDGFSKPMNTSANYKWIAIE